MQAVIGGKKGHEKLNLPHIKETFPAPSEVINQLVVSMIAEVPNEFEEVNAWIAADMTGEALENWEIESVPDVISLE